MNLSEVIVTVLGLALFEAVSSIDNAVVNADVLAKMPSKWRRWFLVWGILIAVFFIRGFLPLLIVYLATPGLSISQAFVATFSSDPKVKEIIEAQAPILLAGGGIFLVFLFFHWLFIEKKKYAFFLERHIHQNYYFWFYAIVSLILLSVVWITIGFRPLATLGAVIGSSVFFIINGFRQNAEEKEKQLAQGNSHLTAISKLIYLELIDATFSIDGVVGAFAFTISVPLILIGNGLGAYIVRYLTVHGVHAIQKYSYLKNGAMYSIGFLGVLMIAESLGKYISSWLPPLITFLVIGLFLFLSKRELNLSQQPSSPSPQGRGNS